MRRFHGKVRDDAGSILRLYRMVYPEDFKVSGKKKKKKKPQQHINPYFLFVGVPLIYGVTGWAVVYAKSGSAMDGAIGGASGAIAYCLAGILYQVVRNHKHANAMKHMCLRDRICPSCGYSIAGLPKNEYALTICPECQSTWRLEQAE
ncbi:MAG: hypothetical protein H6815_12485 [Phycisphaeraceae bacterium]|nr:hypothetical protein [Phycisphaerales bacterium]MCB9861258.1 hypothetical protein [Phycisphaeraceae bacterium]